MPTPPHGRLSLTPYNLMWERVESQEHVYVQQVLKKRALKFNVSGGNKPVASEILRQNPPNQPWSNLAIVCGRFSVSGFAAF